MSIHDGTSPDESLPATPAANTPTDAEKLLAKVIELLAESLTHRHQCMMDAPEKSHMRNYWFARHNEAKGIHDFFAGQTVESLLAMYEEDEKI